MVRVEVRALAGAELRSRVCGARIEKPVLPDKRAGREGIGDLCGRTNGAGSYDRGATEVIASSEAVDCVAAGQIRFGDGSGGQMDDGGCCGGAGQGEAQGDADIATLRRTVLRLGPLRGARA